mgnify:FL=1
MATLIEQHPLYDILTVGQEVIFTVSNTLVVSAFTNVKFSAEVHISSSNPINLSTNNDRVGTFKTTPNNAGVGMFDLRPIIESFAKADNLAREGSAYKGTVNTTESNVPIHLIDKYSGNINTMRYFAIQFYVEYIDAAGDLQITDFRNSENYKIINGYLKHSDDLSLIGNNFGYNINSLFQFFTGSNIRRFLTNAPKTQYANLEDYGTLGMLTTNPSYFPFLINGTVGVELNYFNASGGYLNSEVIYHSQANGAFSYPQSDIQSKILFLGIYPANLQGSSTMFQGFVSAGTIQGGYYNFTVIDQDGFIMSATYTINLNCPTLKGYEPIRLTWLNQWGAWDYYTFNMKSTKTISTKGSTYQQLEGSWNESVYKIDSFKGGKKAFRVNATEKIKMNTDFVSESESEWFEELINSPEVYILEGFQDDTVNSALNNYVIPVRLTTSSYTKKTVANDKLMQYTFEVEKSKTLRTQSV